VQKGLPKRGKKKGPFLYTNVSDFYFYFENLTWENQINSLADLDLI
jgi:hypothetical protein